MVRLVVIQPFVLSGSGFGCCVSIWPVGLLRLGFIGVLMCLAGSGLVCLLFSTWLALFSIFGLRFWRLVGLRFLQTCAPEKAFGREERPFWDFSGTLQLLNSSQVRERDKALLRSIMVGGVWNGFLLSKVKGQRVPCRFCGGDYGEDHLFWDCTFPPLVEIREHPEFHEIMEMEKSCCPGCLLGHGWLPMPWTENPAEGASNLVESALGAYTSDLVDWQLPVGFDAASAAGRVAAEHDVWTDGSLVEDNVSGAFSSGSGFLLVVLVIFGGDILVMMLVGTGSCRGYCSVPGPLHTVQRAEFWRSFLHFRLLMAFTLVLIIWVLHVMSIAC